MNEPFQSNEKASSVESKQLRLRQIVDDYLARRAGGEAIAQEELLKNNPDFQQEIASELLKLQVIDKACRQAGDQPSTATTSLVAGHETALLIRCPHCQTRIQVWDEQPFIQLKCSSCGQRVELIGSASSVVAPQQIGHFELVEHLGSGSFGTVWRAHDSQLNRDVAVKIPRRRHLDTLEIEEFVREARVAAQLRHPHIVTVYEVGLAGETVYIVSDLIRGVTLQSWAESQPMTFSTTADLCKSIAEALHHAHEAGVVHRDLKPANILIDDDGNPHLTDFGLAKHATDEIAMTLAGHILGTPAYMSPEQARGDSRSCDRRSDIYSLGVVLFELLTGELPFRGNMSVLPHKVIHDPPPSPRRLNRYVPRDLETLCLKCLEKDPQNRCQTAAEFAEELSRYGRGEPIRARPVGIATRLVRWSLRQPHVAALTAAVLALLLAIPVLTTWGFIRERVLRTELQTAYSQERELRQQNEEIIESQRKLLTFIVNTDTVRNYWNRAEELARQPELLDILTSNLADPELSKIRDQLKQLPANGAEFAACRRSFIEHRAREQLQDWVDARYAESESNKVFAWFLQDPQGLQLARSPLEKNTIGHNYAWRAYFHGADEDYQHPEEYLANPESRVLGGTHLSTPFLTESTDQWVVALSTPVVRAGRLLGVLGVFLYIERPRPHEDNWAP